MAKHRKSDILFCVLLMVTLLGVMLAIIFRDKEEVQFYEQRYLAELPEASLETVLDGTYFDDLENYVTDHAFLRTTLSRADAWADVYLLRRPVVNEVVVADDLLLGYNTFTELDPERVERQSAAMADRLGELDDLISSYGGTFCYVAVPGQTAYYADRYPSYVESTAAYTDLVLETFSRDLAEQGVSFLDMAEVFAAEGNPEHYFSTVDYHFSFYGALSTYRAIVEWVNENTDHALTVYTEDDFDLTELPNPYMGSRGRKLLGVWDSDERLVTAALREDIPFTRFNNGQEAAASLYMLPGTYWEPIFYDVYMGGDWAETVIDTGRDDLPSILLYGDSFTNAVECVLYASFGTMTSIDLRSYDEMSLAAYIEETQPDIVICLRDYEVLLEFGGNGNVFGQ